LVEHNLAKVGVASSSLVSRSRFTKPRQTTGVFLFKRLMLHSNFRIRARWQSGYAAACKAVDAGSIPTLASNLMSSRSVTDLKTGIVQEQYLAGVSSKRLTALIFSVQGVLRLFRPHIYCGRYFMTVFLELGFNVLGSTSVENDPFM
jgi:hypothetical protein